MNVRSIAVLVLLAGVGACRGARIPRRPARAPEAAPMVRPPRPWSPARPASPSPRRRACPRLVVWDERVSPSIDCNPVKTQHTLVVTVLDNCGCPMPGQRVEWILARSRNAVGDIVAVDDQYTEPPSIAPIGRRARLGNGGNKIDNQYAVSVTNWEDETHRRGEQLPLHRRERRAHARPPRRRRASRGSR